MNNGLYYFVLILKVFLIISVGSVIGQKILNKTYDFQFYLYIFIGMGVYFILLKWGDEIKHDKTNNRNKRS